MLRAALILQTAQAATYLPGVAPRSYSPEDSLKLYVNKLTSTHTQIPYDYYSLPFCHPRIKQVSENIGEKLAGDKIENSLYKLSVLKNQPCKIVCRKKVTKIGAKRFARAIDDDYRVHWIVDNLPASTLLTNKVDPTRPYHVRGFPVGFRQEDEAGKTQHFLFNHVKIVVSVHRAVERSTEEDERVRVVGFRVEPYSIKHVYDENIDFNVKTTQLNTCSAQRPARNDPTNYQRIDGSTEVVFTYDVEWEDSATPWAHRWDVFLQGNPDDKIHWFSVLTQRLFRTFPNFNFASMASRQCHAASTPSTRPSERLRVSRGSRGRVARLSFHTDHEQHDDRRLFDGHGRHDFGANVIAGHRPLQRRCTLR